MNDRARAIALLQQARDILTERLTERLLESRDTVLEDALGLAYSSEIDAIVDQIGQRLNNINVLLNNLPPQEDSPPPQADDIVPLVAAPVLGYEPTTTETASAEPSLDALEESAAVAPAVIYVGADGEPTVVPSFQDFVSLVLAGDLEGGAAVLAPLLNLPGERARQCSERFRDQLREQPQFLQKASGLRNELAAGSVNGALLLLWECFGLQGLESVTALQSLRSRVTPGRSTPSST